MSNLRPAFRRVIEAFGRPAFSRVLPARTRLRRTGQGCTIMVSGRPPITWTLLPGDDVVYYLRSAPDNPVRVDGATISLPGPGVVAARGSWVALIRSCRGPVRRERERLHWCGVDGRAAWRWDPGGELSWMEASGEVRPFDGRPLGANGWVVTAAIFERLAHRFSPGFPAMEKVVRVAGTESAQSGDGGGNHLASDADPGWSRMARHRPMTSRGRVSLPDKIRALRLAISEVGGRFVPESRLTSILGQGIDRASFLDCGEDTDLSPEDAWIARIDASRRGKGPVA